MLQRLAAFCTIVCLIGALPAGAQPKPGVARIGYIHPFPSAYSSSRFSLFKEKLRELGYEEGKTVAYEVRSGDGKYDRLPALAADLVKLKVDIIMADGGTPPTMAAMGATRSIPIVFCCVADPVAQA